LQLALGGIDPGHVGEGGAGALLAVEPGLALPEAKEALLLPAYPPADEPEQADQEDERQQIDQETAPDLPRRGGRGNPRDLHAVTEQEWQQGGIANRRQRGRVSGIAGAVLHVRLLE